jgi:predicted NBD/HSP70 family sugar kinase
MTTLVIDIGGTKFTVAAFEGSTIVRRLTRSTDKEGGREWMLQQIEEIALAWNVELQFDRCGVGFGGPVDFARRSRYAIRSGPTKRRGYRSKPYAGRLRRVGPASPRRQTLRRERVHASRRATGRGFV